MPPLAEDGALFAANFRLMGLTEYRRKRNFRVTSEPKGAGRATTSHRAARKSRTRRLSFVVQKHAASHLHFDFRLELDGVLKSWAVPKGPSLNPAEKRLAMQVEDHPLEYARFEGVIPPGEYGGGTVMIWDEGAWEPVDDGPAGYRDGALKFTLFGQRLKGRWMLVRRGGKRGDPEERHWFLFKERDEFAAPDVDVTAKETVSVTTGRDMDAIARQADRVWGRDGEQPRNGRARVPARSGVRRNQGKKRGKVKLDTGDRAAITKELRRLGKKGSWPKTMPVQLATLAEQTPAGEDWLHEIKFDGYRMLCMIQDGKARFVSRNGKDWTSRFDDLSSAAGQLPVIQAVLDGEVVIMQSDGTTSFQALQNAFQSRGYYAFDLMYLNGYDVRAAAIEDRKALLQRIIPDDADSIKFSEHVVGNGPEFFTQAARLKLEGVICKRLGRPYVGGRGLDWLKVKCSLREEFVVGGFTAPSGSRTNFGALLLGYYDRQKKLRYAGRVGTGFDQRSLEELHERFLPLVRKTSPFEDLSGNTGAARGVTWLAPSLVAQVRFSNWTDERQLRHPAFQGLREDKAARDVVRDDPVPAPAVKSAKTAKTMPKTKLQPKTRKTRTTTQDQDTELRATDVAAASDAVAGVRLSHPDKVLYPEQGVTKLDLARHYELVAEWMLPHVENRLLSLVRCPSGHAQKCFYQKHPGDGTPEMLRRFSVVEKQKTEEHLALYDLPGLVSLVQMGVLEIHTWGSQADQLEKPDRLIFDLDPDPAVEWPHVVNAAKEMRLLLEDLDLVSFLKTTGGKGLHVVVPIRRRTSWEDAKAFCRAVAELTVAAAPDRYVATMSKAARRGKIFVDYLRNDRGATAIAPYSTRARPGATVSVPIAWDELTNRLTSDYFHVANIARRLARLKEDPWQDLARTNQTITASMMRKLSVR